MNVPDDCPATLEYGEHRAFRRKEYGDDEVDGAIADAMHDELLLQRDYYKERQEAAEDAWQKAEAALAEARLRLEQKTALYEGTRDAYREAQANQKRMSAALAEAREELAEVQLERDQAHAAVDWDLVGNLQRELAEARYILNEAWLRLTYDQQVLLVLFKEAHPDYAPGPYAPPAEEA